MSGFQVDFEGRKDVCREHRVTGRSTLILFQGTREIARRVGITLESEIASLRREAERTEPRGRPNPRPKHRAPARP